MAARRSRLSALSAIEQARPPKYAWRLRRATAGDNQCDLRLARKHMAALRRAAAKSSSAARDKPRRRLASLMSAEARNRAGEHRRHLAFNVRSASPGARHHYISRLHAVGGGMYPATLEK